MPASRKPSLIVFVVATLLAVGLVPLVLTGYFLSDRSGRELRSAENRYQIQLVQEKARQIEIFGRRVSSIVTSVGTAVELANDASVINSPVTEAKLEALLRENADVIAIAAVPAAGDPLLIFRAESINRQEVEAITRSAIGGSRVSVGDHVRLQNGGFALPFSCSVNLGTGDAVSVTAIASLRSISQGVVGINAAAEADLWNAGLPIVFVVNRAGEALFHPDRSLSSSRRSMKDLRIVNEWLESGVQVDSALVPFSATFGGKNYQMIGAYSTAQLAEGFPVGVIAMQDEARALASVGDMRARTWQISLLFALMALAVGFAGARYMTSPLLRLVSAAKQIASGDLSVRVAADSTVSELSTLGAAFNVMTDKVEEQIVNLAKAAEENRELFIGTVKALAAAIDGKDKYTRGHSERVSRISVAIGKRMGLNDDELEALRISALLHDIGKIAIDDAILKKPAALTEDEFEIMKTHPQRGYKIMKNIPAMKDYLPGMYMHHEMVNGKGYPQGLTGDEIPLQAKIISVADTFDAMTIDRPYQKGMELPAALERLRSFVGTRYQHEVVEALVDACEAGEVANGIIRQLAAIRAVSQNGSNDSARDLSGDPRCQPRQRRFSSK
jgi:HD-GYP domain-containing protein (c-di-GMP phosphodiesterase class II)